MTMTRLLFNESPNSWYMKHVFSYSETLFVDNIIHRLKITGLINNMPEPIIVKKYKILCFLQPNKL